MSAIVRELVTFVRFTFDKKGLKDSENAVLRFSTKLALVSTGLVLAANRITSFFSNVANQFLATDNVAKTTGIALQNLKGMQKAASQFGLTGEDINSIFSKLNQLMIQARYGQGELVKLALDTGVVYKDNNGQLLKNEEIFKNILSFGAQISDETQRIEYFSKLFGEEVAVGLSKVSREFETFSKQSNAYAESVASNLEEQEKAANAVRNSITSLNNSWQSLGETLLQHVGPALALVLDSLSLLVEIYSKVLVGAGKVFSQGAKFIGDNFQHAVVKDAYAEKEEFEAFAEKAANGTWTIWDFLGFPSPPQMAPANARGGAIANITTNIDVQVPPGTNVSDTQQMAQLVSQMINAELDYTINQIYNNNPELQ